MNTYTIVNIDWSSGVSREVHKENCRDTRKVHPRQLEDIEAADMRAIVDSVYGPKMGGFYEESDGCWEEYATDFRVMPCAGKIEWEVTA